MKKYLAVLFLLTLWSGWGQIHPKDSVEKAIAGFFEAFHAQDSMRLRQMVSPAMRMQTVGRSSTGTDSVITIPFGNFLRSITSIPDSVRFEERLLSIAVEVDGNLAQAWTPYEFWVNGELSHCGANAFQLFYEGASWKILQIIDTRRREGCSK